MVNGVGVPGGVTIVGRAVGCKIRDGVRTTIGEQGFALLVWTWVALVGVMEGVGVGSMPRGIEVRGRVLIGVDVEIVDG